MTKQPHTPKFKVGQHVRYAHTTLGHDRECLKTKGAKVARVWQGDSPRDTSYRLEGSPSIHPETRLI